MWQYVVRRKVLRPYDCVPTVWTNNIRNGLCFLIVELQMRSFLSLGGQFLQTKPQKNKKTKTETTKKQNYINSKPNCSSIFVPYKR